MQVHAYMVIAYLASGSHADKRCPRLSAAYAFSKQVATDRALMLQQGTGVAAGKGDFAVPWSKTSSCPRISVRKSARGLLR